MRILLIRHGDPDYIHDTLTAKGRREAELLAETAQILQLGDCYVSPLGRARDTADYTLKKLGKKAEIMDWLQEFPAQVDINQSDELQKAYNDTKIEGKGYKTRIPWDMLPSYWTSHPEYWDREEWRHSEIARQSDMVSVYDWAAKELDRLLASYGYVRTDMHYRVEWENKQTVTFFCHFGITCMLLSHLWNMSPFILWHSLALAPASVTEVVTEEREQGIACFRALRLGDVSHLYMGGELPSFSARFCECFRDEERH
ncbi:histidine phosphatase family protein [Lachnospiraceae bacterium 62-35]